MVNIYLSNL